MVARGNGNEAEPRARWASAEAECQLRWRLDLVVGSLACRRRHHGPQAAGIGLVFAILRQQACQLGTLASVVLGVQSALIQRQQISGTQAVDDQAFDIGPGVVRLTMAVCLTVWSMNSILFAVDVKNSVQNPVKS